MIEADVLYCGGTQTNFVFLFSQRSLFLVMEN